MTWTPRPQKPPFALPPGYGELTLRLIGPLHVAHDDAGLQTTGIPIGPDLVPGTWLLHVDVIITQDWDGITDDNFSFNVALAPTVDPADWWAGGWEPVLAESMTTSVGQQIAHGILMPNGPGYFEFRRVSVSDGGTLWVFFSPDGENTQGEADIYALVAE